MNKQITIIGLDRLGISLGLAIKKEKDPADCTGFDQNPTHTRAALDNKAVDRIAGNLRAAVEKADLVFLNSLPVDVTGWMEDIFPLMKPGGVLINMAPVHSLASEWAAAQLSAGCNLINASFCINGKYLDSDDYTADLFSNGLMVISSPVGTDPQAIQSVLDLAAVIGASPMFSDPLESDGLITQSDLFPRLLSMLYVQAISAQSGWKDAKKVTGPEFWQMSKMTYEFPSGNAAAHEITAHRSYMLHLLDMMRDQIDQFSEKLQQDDSEELKKSIQKILDANIVWMNRRISGDWDSPEGKIEIKKEGLAKRLFGIEFPKKKP